MPELKEELRLDRSPTADAESEQLSDTDDVRQQMAHNHELALANVERESLQDYIG